MTPGSRVTWNPPAGVGPKYGTPPQRGGPYNGVIACWVGEGPFGRIALVYHDINRDAYVAFENELTPAVVI